MGDHPITWCQNYGGGRSFYTALGHTEASYTESNFTRMLLGAIQWAGGAQTATCTPATAPPTTPPPTNPPVAGTAWKALANNKFVTASAGNLIASATAASTNAERFDVVDLGGGNVALKSRANGMYVCAENAGANPLVANRAAAGAWETFARINNSDGSVSFRAQANGRYVVAENGGAAALIANRTAIGAWEKFSLTN
jgi:hypothetical protein